MRRKKIKDLSNLELVAEYGDMAEREVASSPGPNRKEFKKAIQRHQLLRIELLTRLGEPKESIYKYAWEQEAWADDAKRSGQLHQHLSGWKTDKEQPLTLSVAIQEAISLLGTYNVIGHKNHGFKHGEGAGNPQEVEKQKAAAREEMRLIRAFIRKYKRPRL
ncbi:hypothetical protein [Paenibacillus polymyxa]|uniref:hypothetical protein n=1 Tax=Paenibacillus polymyxa TaxID=1406 RepID=UPI00111998DE|nr:hypothetical protein [Paenibacillus polymyxa]QDA30255.1 hypothetical protein FGY93_25410 [Paenibacillus polymyxa]